MLKYALTKKQGVKMWSNLPEMVVESNLVLQVAHFLQQEFQPPWGVEIELEKRIPIAAGLGGGSSNAANVIRALNFLWGLDLSMSEMESIAARFGSDIAFFLHGGTAWATHRGEVVTPCEDILIDGLLLVNPHIAISSAEAYRLAAIPDEIDRRRFQMDEWRECCFNRLEPAIRKEYPAVDGIIATLQDMGARPALMSGSGSTCFGVFDDTAQMRKCQDHFARKGYWTQIARTISKKEYQSVFET